MQIIGMHVYKAVKEKRISKKHASGYTFAIKVCLLP